MQEYDIKRGHFNTIEGEKLKQLIAELFGAGNVEEQEDKKLTASYGALAPLTIWVKDKVTLCVETTMDTNVDDSVAMDTVRKYNRFLETATGFNAKQRKQRMTKKMKSSKS